MEFELPRTGPDSGPDAESPDNTAHPVSLPPSQPETEPEETQPEIVRQDDLPPDDLRPDSFRPDADPQTATVASSAIRDLALTLFDCTRPLHNLDEGARLVLAESAGLYSRPIPHTKKKPYKTTLAWVQANAGQTAPESGRPVMAAVLAYQQGKLKRKEIAGLEDLSPAEVHQALALSALLRMSIDLAGCGGDLLDSVNLTDESIWLVINGPQAETAAAAVAGAGRLWTKLGYPEFEVLEKQDAAIRLLPLPEETERIGLTAGDPLSEAGRKALRFQFARMLGQEEGTRLGEDIEALHHMRVATRRLRAAFEVFDAAFEPGALKPYLKMLRQAGRALGKVRDLDVLMDKARKYAQSLPDERRAGIDPLLEHWTAQREAARQEMLAYLDGKDYADFKRKFNIFVNTPGAGARPVPPGQPVPHTVRDLAPALIYERMAAVRGYAPLLADAPVETLHALRIEFKKLRYTVEYFQEALGKRSKVVLDLCKQLQDHLGDLNDAEVASLLLRQFIDEWDSGQDTLPIHKRRHIGEVVNYLAYNHSERHRLMTTFQDIWHKRFEHSAFRRSLAQAVSVL